MIIDERTRRAFRIESLIGSPVRNLVTILAFMAVVVTLSTAGYLSAGWSFRDAIYMVALTVYSVGYEEVRPINTAFLHALTMGTIVLGCTGMIFLTSSLVQVFTVSQINRIFGQGRMKSEIGRLSGHVIICGFGRIGVMLARDLAAAGTAFVVIERNESRLAEAVAMGCLCVQGDATDEAHLIAAGVERARALATVLPDDAANVFITLSARNLNRRLEIIARGEAPTTESKLIHAGADKVVLPTHIGAERIAEMILYPETARFIRGSDRMRDFDKTLRDVGLELEVVTAVERAPAVGLTVAEAERRGRGAFFVVQLNRRDGEAVTRPPQDMNIAAGDGVVVVAKGGRAALRAVFDAPATVKAGRTILR